MRLRPDDEWWNVFLKPELSLREREPADVHVLMKNAGTAQKRGIVDPNVSAEQTIVRDDHVVADLAIVPDVRAGHEKIIVADLRRGSFRCAAMNRAVFANDIVVADDNSRSFDPVKTKGPAAARR